MYPDHIDKLARLLIDARVNGQPLDGQLGEIIPDSIKAAYAVDDRIAELSGWPVLGWKVGCTSPAAQQILNTDAPFAGRIYDVRHDGVTLSERELMVEPLLEGEFVFELASSVGPQNPITSDADLAKAVKGVRPGIEIVGGRFSQFVGTPLNLLIADSGSNTALVLGELNDTVDMAKLTELKSAMSVDGQVSGQGSGADVSLGPLGVLGWLCDHLTQRGITLRSGQMISTGTTTQVSKLPAGSEAELDIDQLGSVKLRRA